jgi:alpha-D-ribose 1-methylphosphonate 5-triphosphate synthase subunit PhnH
VSALAAVKPYDETFDAQKHYRTLLDCTARPGTIGQLDDVQLQLPPQYNHATALIALALFGADTTYYHPSDADCSFLRMKTGAKASSVEQADFVILFDSEQLVHLDVRSGTLSYPETGSTVIAQVEGISTAPMPGSLRLRLTGPGIETETVVFVSGASEAFFDFRRDLNFEFPIGVDMFLTCDSLSMGPCVLALPRTTRIDWERI